MVNKFAYNDELDKCYGLTGTVISINMLDNEYMIHRLSIDDDDAITFTPDFFFCSNPRFSAKIAWNEMIKQYQLFVAMVVGNILCRTRVHSGKPLSMSSIPELRNLVQDEGREVCSLEDDEIDTIFSKTFRYLDSVFADSRVKSLSDSFASYLQAHRSISGDEIVDLLQMLK